MYYSLVPLPKARGICMGVLFGDFSPRISWTFSTPSACYFPRGTAGQGCSRPCLLSSSIILPCFSICFIFFSPISGRVEKRGSHKRHTVLPLTWERQQRPFVTSQRAESQNCFLGLSLGLSKKKKRRRRKSWISEMFIDRLESHYYNICITFSVYLYQLPLMKIDDEDAMPLVCSVVFFFVCFFKLTT